MGAVRTGAHFLFSIVSTKCTFYGISAAARKALATEASSQRRENFVENTIVVFGITLKQIYLQAVLVAIAVMVNLGVVLQLLRNWWSQRGNRRFDHYLVTRNKPSAPNAEGLRTLPIRNKGGNERIEAPIRGNDIRKWMIAAAARCDWEHQRFIADPNPERQQAILKAILNGLNQFYVDGQNAEESGQPVKKYKLYFAPTGADSAAGGVRQIRIMTATHEELEIFYKHPQDMWEFEKLMGIDTSAHHVRVDTMRKMAKAAFENGGKKHIDGKWVQIVGEMEAVVPVYGADLLAS